MNYGKIKEYDIADGEGIRITLFVSGCTNYCKGCFQPETWDFNYGKPFTCETENRILTFLQNDFVDGLTLLGGEPMEPENQRTLVKLCREVKAMFPKKTIWSYTGFVYENDLLPGRRKHCEVTDELLTYIDVLVDGPFVEELADITLTFRGSSNQRIIDMKETLKRGEVVLYKCE